MNTNDNSTPVAKNVGYPISIFGGCINKEFMQVVDGRELHQAPQVGRQFATWINNRINEYDFLENQDFIAISQNREIGHGRGKIEYHLSLDMAKELAMLERNSIGKQIRRYFIQCEKQLHQKQKEKISNEQFRFIREAVNALSERTGEPTQSIDARLFKMLTVRKTKDILSENYSHTMTFLEAPPKPKAWFPQLEASEIIQLKAMADEEQRHDSKILLQNIVIKNHHLISKPLLEA